MKIDGREINYSMLPQHMIGSVKLYIEDGKIPGSFLTAVLSNQLVNAFANADDVNIAYMHQWAKFLCNELPAGSWGSPQIMEKWIKMKRKENSNEV